MKIHKKSLVSITRALRKNQTPWENKLWYYLRAGRFNGLKFKRQVMIGEYIVDFCSNEKKIVIEIDGGQHNKTAKLHTDHVRDEYLRSNSYEVLRFWNNDIEQNIEGVLERIEYAIR